MDIARRNALLIAAACTVFGRTSAQAADGPKRVLVVGDSQAQGLAGGLQRRAKRGTARFDWPASASGIADKERGAVAVVMFGANDRPPVRSNGAIDPRRAETFAISYCAHIRAVASGLKQACPEVVWVGHPVVRDPVYAEDMAFLNQLYENEAVACGARWFSSWPLFVDKAGLYTAHGKTVSGQTERLRADDGVHLTGAGYDVLASALLPDLRFALAGPLNPPT